MREGWEYNDLHQGYQLRKKYEESISIYLEWNTIFSRRRKKPSLLNGIKRDWKKHERQKILPDH